MHELPQAILLNGTSSSGKTTIARELQEHLELQYLNFSIDSILYTLPPSDLRAMIKGDRITRRGYKYGRLVQGFHAAIAGLLKTGNYLIIDNAITREEWNIDFENAVDGYHVVRIGVFCDLLISRQREIARGDRAIGTVDVEFPLVHMNKKYDFSVDTSTATVADVSSAIICWLKSRCNFKSSVP